MMTLLNRRSLFGMPSKMAPKKKDKVCSLKIGCGRKGGKKKMCHVSHLTDALLGMPAPGLAVRATARSSTGVVCLDTVAKSRFHSFPIGGTGAIHTAKSNYAKFIY